MFLDEVFEGTAYDYWRDRIQPALDQSRHLIVVWTQEAGRRREAWDPVWEECEHFVSAQGAERVILTLARGEPTQACPGDLSSRHPRMEYRDLRGLSPVRWTWLPRYVGIEEELSRIAGALLGVPLQLMPELIREDRNRWLRALSLAGSIGAVVLLLVTLLFLDRNRALTEASRNLASAYAARGLLAVGEGENHKAQLFLTRARELDDSPKWVPFSILVGRPTLGQGEGPWEATGMSDLVFLPDGSRFVAACEEGLEVRQSADGALVRRLGGSAGFRAPCVHASGRWLAARNSNRIGIWDLTVDTDPLEVVAETPRGRRVTASGLALHPLRDELACGLPDGSIRIHARTGELLRELPSANEDYVDELAQSPDGRWIAWKTGNSQTVFVASLQEPGQCLRLEAGEDIVTSLSFSPDMRFLAATGPDSLTRLWDLAGLATGSVESRLDRAPHAGFVWTHAFSPDGTLLATGGEDHSVVVWDLRESRPTLLARTRTQRSSLRRVHFTPDGRALVSIADDGRVECWRIDPDGRRGRVFPHGDGLGSVAWSPDGRWLALSGTMGSIWASLDGIDPRVLRRSEACRVLGVYDGSSVGSGFEAQEVRLIDAVSGQLVLRPEALKARGAARAWTVDARSVAFSADGRWLAGAPHQKHLALWDPATGRLDRTLLLEGVNARAIAFATNGARVATAGLDGRVGLYDLEAEREAPRLQFQAGGSLGNSIERMELEGELLGVWMFLGGFELWHLTPTPVRDDPPQGRWTDASLAAGRGVVRKDGRLRLHDVDSGRAVGPTFARVEDERCEVRLSPQGDLVAVSPRDEAIQLWSTLDGMELARLPTDRGDLRFLTFDPFGSLAVAWVSQAGVVAFFDARTGEPVGDLEARVAPHRASFSPDGSSLLLLGHVSATPSLLLLSGMIEWNAAALERSSGHRLNGMTAIPDTRGAVAVGASPSFSDIDRPLAELLRDLQSTRARLASGAEDVAAAEPLRAWIAEHPDSPWIRDLPRLLESLLAGDG